MAPVIPYAIASGTPDMHPDDHDCRQRQRQVDITGRRGQQAVRRDDLQPVGNQDEGKQSDAERHREWRRFDAETPLDLVLDLGDQRLPGELRTGGHTTGGPPGDQQTENDHDRAGDQRRPHGIEVDPPAGQVVAHLDVGGGVADVLHHAFRNSLNTGTEAVLTIRIWNTASPPTTPSPSGCTRNATARAKRVKMPRRMNTPPTKTRLPPYSPVAKRATERCIASTSSQPPASPTSTNRPATGCPMGTSTASAAIPRPLAKMAARRRFSAA